MSSKLDGRPSRGCGACDSSIMRGARGGLNLTSLEVCALKRPQSALPPCITHLPGGLCSETTTLCAPHPSSRSDSASAVSPARPLMVHRRQVGPSSSPASAPPPPDSSPPPPPPLLLLPVGEKSSAIPDGGRPAAAAAAVAWRTVRVTSSEAQEEGAEGEVEEEEEEEDDAAAAAAAWGVDTRDCGGGGNAAAAAARGWTGTLAGVVWATGAALTFCLQVAAGYLQAARHCSSRMHECMGVGPCCRKGVHTVLGVNVFPRDSA